MLTQISEVTYAPLSTPLTFKAKLEDRVCTVKNNLDEVLTLNTRIIEDTVLLSVMNAPSADHSDLMLMALELILGHGTEIKKIEIQGARTLSHPFFNSVKKDTETLSFHRCEFFQIPTLWHTQKQYQVGHEKWTETKTQKHPIRPAARKGIVYKRYLPHLQKTVTFRLTDPEKDLDIFHQWHNSFRVSFFWELNKPKEELKEYMKKGLQDPHQIPLLVEMDGEALGYYEMYWVAEDRLGPYYDVEAFDRGFHFLIGNKKFLGYSITDSVIKSALHFLFLDDPRTRRIMAEPRSDNQKVLKYAEASIGWKKLKEFDFPHKRAALLECRREGFFEGNAL